MKKLTCSMLGMLFLTCMAVAQPKTAAGDDVAAAIKGLEEKWVQAGLKGDAAGLSALLADGILTVSNTGAVQTKAEMIERFKTVKYQASKIDDMKVTVYGDAAVVVGHWQGKGIEKGKAFDESERFTDTWVKQNGQWRCVATQGTLIAKK